MKTPFFFFFAYFFPFFVFICCQTWHFSVLGMYFSAFFAQTSSCRQDEEKG